MGRPGNVAGTGVRGTRCDGTARDRNVPLRAGPDRAAGESARLAVEPSGRRSRLRRARAGLQPAGLCLPGARPARCARRATAPDGRAVRVGLAIGALVAIELAIAAPFPATGDPPFTVDAFAGVLALCAFAALLAVRAPQGRTLAAFFLLWAAASVVAFALPTPIGSNLARLRLVAFPLVLLAACLARFRTPLLALGAIVLALLATVAPYRTQIPSIVNGRTDEAAFWVSPLAFLRAHADPNYRVEVIPTGGHWEAFYLPRAGFPLARGWYRQLDMSENPLLYRKRLNPAAYRGWLRRMGVRFVLRAHAGLDGNGTATEAALVDSGRSGLVQVFGDRSWSIYELPKATPLLTPAGAARLTHVGRELVTGWARKRGSYRLRIHYTPDWQVEQGAVCTLRAADGMTVLRVE